MSEQLNGLQTERTPNQEALLQLADWWGKRLICTPAEVKENNFFLNLDIRHPLAYAYFALVTHHCSNEKRK